MSDSQPNCVVDVRFDQVSGHFSYACSNSTRGWQVYPDGSIYPAIIGRRVQFRIKNDPGTTIKLAGFQISGDELGAVPPAEPWQTPPEGITPVPANSYPTSGTVTDLTLDLSVQRWFYRLAVAVAEGESNSEPIWDEPSIHDDGSQ